MRLILTLVLMLGLFSLSGCKLLQVKGEVAGVEIEAQTKENKKDNDGDFCPPGQAKKGRC